MKPFIALLCGTLFGFGLALSGMTDTQKVIGFLDIFGHWIPDLALVMASAVIATTIGFRWVLQKSSPLFDNKFYLPTKIILDKKLISGAALFGIGWGLYGYCPGPAIAALAYLNSSSLIFLISMFVGMLLFHYLEKASIKP